MCTQNDQSKWLIIPMEIVERELNGYLLLAIEAAKRGYKVLIGTKREIFTHMQHIPKGVVFLKSLTTDDIGHIENLREAGHIVVSQDVEGLIYTSMDEFVTVRFHEDAIKNAEQIYFWGDIQREAVAQAFPHHADRMTATGSPINDIWNPSMRPLYQSQIDSIKQRFGKYILLPSSFGTANHFMGKQGNAAIMKEGKFVAEEKEEEFYKFWTAYEAHLEKMFNAYLEILPEIARNFPDHQIIVRPHPAESHESWKAKAKGCDNVTVIFEGVVAPWLLGADAILHWGCTTGLEGYLMGKPVVAYNPATPEDDAQFEHKLPHSISIITRTHKDTINALSSVISDPETVLKRYPAVHAGDKALDAWLCRRADGKNGVMRIMDEMDKLNVQSQAFVPFKRDAGSKKERSLLFLAQFAVILKPLLAPLPERIRKGIETRAYGRHKTRDIDAETVNYAANVLSAYQNAQGIKTKRVHKNLYQIFCQN